jgi:hypothetical protein
MDVIAVADLAIGVTGPSFVDLGNPASAAELASATAAAERAHVPLVGFCTGALEKRLEPLASALALTLVEQETTQSTVRVDDVAAVRAAISAQVIRNPHASTVLVGLLRITPGLAVGDGLVSESLAYSLLLTSPEFQRWREATPRHEVRPDREPTVLLERDADVLTIRLHRPRRHNAFNRDMRDALIEALLVAELDSSVRVRLRGDGPSFCSGGDLDEFGTASDQAAAHLVRVTQSAGAAVHRLRDRTTVRLHGACIGAGIEIPAFAGRVEANPDVRIQLPELRMGLVPGAGGTVSVMRRVGRWRTAFLVLSGVAIDATTACRWGLVDEIC